VILPCKGLGPSAIVPVLQAVFRNGSTRASCGRCLLPASHLLPAPGAAAAVCQRHPFGACRIGKPFRSKLTHKWFKRPLGPTLLLHSDLYHRHSYGAIRTSSSAFATRTFLFFCFCHVAAGRPRRCSFYRKELLTPPVTKLLCHPVAKVCLAAAGVVLSGSPAPERTRGGSVWPCMVNSLIICVLISTFQDFFDLKRGTVDTKTCPNSEPPW
jgi:hypothetical protein